MRRHAEIVWFLPVGVMLMAIAAAAPSPSAITDRGLYEALAVRRLIPDCDDLHCFRVLAPWLLGAIPASSLIKWKAYAALTNAAAGLAVFRLCTTLGLQNRVGILAGTASAVGFGSMY